MPDIIKPGWITSYHDKNLQIKKFNKIFLSYLAMATDYAFISIF